MTATISIPKPADRDRVEAAKAEVRDTVSTPSAPSAPLSFGAYQARALPTTVIAVFAAVTALMYIFRGDLVGAIGLGAFSAFWLGGGFGFLIGGILYSSQPELHD